MSNNLEYKEVTLEHGQKTVKDHVYVSKAMRFCLYFAPAALLFPLLDQMVFCRNSLFGIGRMSFDGRRKQYIEEAVQKRSKNRYDRKEHSYLQNGLSRGHPGLFGLSDPLRNRKIMGAEH
jgi:hypothetical protein